VVISAGAVSVAPGSTSVGFIPGCGPSNAQCGPGSLVSAEWGATLAGALVEKSLQTRCRLQR
jgi:hypothetical protein